MGGPDPNRDCQTVWPRRSSAQCSPSGGPRAGRNLVDSPTIRQTCSGSGRVAAARLVLGLGLGLGLGCALGFTPFRGLESALAADGPASSNPPQAKSSREPAATESVDLAASRISIWTDPDATAAARGVRWILLEGQAAALQGVEGMRARSILALVSPCSKSAEGRGGWDVFLLGEGDAQFTHQPGQGHASSRLDLRRVPDVRVMPYTASGRAQLPGPPAGNRFVQTAAPTLRGCLGEKPAKGSATATAAALADSAVRPAQLPGSGPPPSRVPEPIPAPSAIPELPDLPSAAQPPPNLDGPVEGTAEPDMPRRGSAPAAAVPPGGSPPTTPLVPRVGPPPTTSEPLPDPLDQLPPLESTAPPRLPTPPSLAPGPGLSTAPPVRSAAPAAPATTPILPGSQRVVSIFASNGGGNFQIETLPTTPEGVTTAVVRGGVTITATALQLGAVDITADNAVIWSGPAPAGKGQGLGSNAELVQDANQPLEVYLEGDVTIRQDERKVAGNGDQRLFKAKRAYYDFRTQKAVALDAEFQAFAPGLIAPIRTKSGMIRQFNNSPQGLKRVFAEAPITTGSRFANPGYQFLSRSVEVFQEPAPLTDPGGTPVGLGGMPAQDLNWKIDAQRNTFYMGPVPVFYWPRFLVDADDLDMPLRQIQFRANRVFGQQLLTDWSGFKLLGLRRPANVDQWNVDLDYLSYRGPAVGTEVGWFGSELIPNLAYGYTGYLDAWGLFYDDGNDVLGPGPAVVTQPPGFGRRGLERTSVPAFQDQRGRFMFRHMQSLIKDDQDPTQDFRLQLELGYQSDRNFLEQYYKRIFDNGPDQAVLAYLLRQRDNHAWSVLAEANPQYWNTESQWLPRFDYYRFGDSLFNGLLSYSQHSGANYANTHTATEVNNRDIFAYMPYDPVSNTQGIFRSFRAYSNHEISAPINLDVMRITPYAQGQLAAWDNQIDGSSMGRYWGSVGARADLFAWRAFSGVENETLNLHGLAHKANFVADFRTTYSNEPLAAVGVQDDLDDNTYEWVRRYFALTNYEDGQVPAQFDPRLLILRRGLSPITATNDVQARIDLLQLGLYQRLQTKRGPENRRRVIDWMIFDFKTTYFPNADRDNFGEAFGQTMFNHEWYVGDRTSIVTNGWFESFTITGQPYPYVVNKHGNNPFGMSVITSGVSLDRPPRGNIYLGYSIIDAGVINTSALNTTWRYMLSPKWFTTFMASYDFGNAILLGSSFSATRIGADYLTTVGLSVDPQRENYTFAFEISPRLSPNLRLGSGTALSRFDSRFSPTQ